MSVYEYLELQEIEPQEDGSISPLDEHKHDETIDLDYDVDGEELVDLWAHIEKDMHSRKQ